MNIAIVFNSAHPGGSELAMVESIKCLHAKGHTIHIITPEQGPLLERLKPYASTFHNFKYNWFTFLPPLMTGWRKYWFAKGYILQSFNMAAILKAIGAEKVITNSISTPAAAMACARLGIPHYWYLHEFGPEDHNLQFLYGEKFTVGKMANWSKAVLVNSKAVYNKFIKFISSEKLRLVYYSVAMPKLPRKQFGSKPDVLKLVMVGRTAAGKRQEDAIKALAEIKKAGIKCSLTFVGTRDERYGKFVDSLIQDLDLTNDVVLAGYTAAPQELVRQADVAVVCSKNEAFGRVTVEAMKLGIPVVATRSAGTLEIITDGENGLLFDPENYLQLAEAVIKLYYNPELLEQFSIKSYESAWEDYNEETHTRKLCEALGL